MASSRWARRVLRPRRAAVSLGKEKPARLGRISFLCLALLDRRKGRLWCECFQSGSSLLRAQSASASPCREGTLASASPSRSLGPTSGAHRERHSGNKRDAEGSRPFVGSSQSSAGGSIPSARRINERGRQLKRPRNSVHGRRTTEWKTNGAAHQLSLLRSFLISSRKSSAYSLRASKASCL
jgi:hypothetical protein